jgi:Na+-transporting NADH:ubiquinone oxidoreductase subunit A
MIKIKKGLDIPVDAKVPDNQYENIIDSKKIIKKVAVIGPDYVGMKPTLCFKKGDNVQKGMPLFNCKKTDKVVYTSPGSGKIVEVNRGARRVFQSIVIELDSNEDEVIYKNFSKNTNNYTPESIRDLLIESGLWTSIRQRPFSRVPVIDCQPKTVFITAMDTNPLMYDPEIIITKYIDDFKFGAGILAKLTRGRVFICTKEDTRLDVSYEDDHTASNSILIKKFAGIHPAGNPGTHIHFLSPNNIKTTTWYIGFQDVIAIGKLFIHGKLWTDRYISLAGYSITHPEIFKTRLGASMDDFLSGQSSGKSIDKQKNRIISGSLLNGFEAKGPFAYLGRYFNQVSVISDQVHQDFLGWISPGVKKFSIMPTFISRMLNKSKFNFNTVVNGSKRAMVPIGAYEKVMPLDTLPTQLLRALLVKDTEMAMDLGVLDLDEEDLALCTFVDPGKIDYGPVLRAVLKQIELEEM